MRRAIWLGCIALVCLSLAGTAAAGPRWCMGLITCWDESEIKCIGHTCTGVYSNCSANEPGWVSCDGNVTHCPPCPLLASNDALTRASCPASTQDAEEPAWLADLGD